MAVKTGLKRIFSSLPIVSQVAANLVVIAAGWFAWVQINDYRTTRSADIILKFGEYLDDDPYLKISESLDTDDKNKKLVAPAGAYSEPEIERYLGTFETLSELYRDRLVTCGMFKTNFSYYLQKAYFNEEIRGYLIDADANGQPFYPNLVVVEKQFGNEKSPAKCDY